METDLTKYMAMERDLHRKAIMKATFLKEHAIWTERESASIAITCQFAIRKEH